MKKIIYIILVIFLAGLNLYFIYEDSFANEKYIIFDNNNIFYLKNNYLKKQNPKNIKTLNFSESKLYSNSINYDYINFNIGDNTYLYDNTLEKVDIYDYYVLSNIDYNLNVKNIDYIENLTNDDKKNINEVLKKYNLNLKIEEISISKSEINLISNDKSTIYNIIYTNENSDTNGVNAYIIFAVIDNNIVIIDKSITDSSQSLTTFNPEAYITIDIDNDNLSEVVISNSKFSMPNSTYYCVYKYDDLVGKFNLISDCK